MKKFILTIMICSFMSSCGINSEEERYSFDNFKNTPLWEIAKAVRSEDITTLKLLMNEKKVDINFKDKKFKQNLLSLSIKNNKRKAFIELLKNGSKPNLFLGELNDELVLVNAIKEQKNCDLFFIENLIKYGANPNLEIKNPHPEYYFESSFPLLDAINCRDDNGDECLNTIKYLVDNGADLNVCNNNPSNGICEGVITYCLITKSMEALRYFVIEKKVLIPKTVYIIGSNDKETEKKYGLIETLNLDDFKFNNVKINSHELDLSKSRIAKEEILNYLKEIK